MADRGRLFYDSEGILWQVDPNADISGEPASADLEPVSFGDLSSVRAPVFNEIDDQTLTILFGVGTSALQEVEAIDLGGQFTNDVTTTAVPIYSLDKANLVYVAGTQEGDGGTQFSDLISAHDFGGLTIIGSATRGTPDGRTYTVDGTDLDLAMAANTYNVLAFAYRLDIQP